MQLSTKSLEEALPDDAERERVQGRAIIARRLQPLPVEAIVRGYLIGSGWQDYQRSGAVCAISLPAGLRLAQQLPEPLFTPSTKAALGGHDENVSFEQIAAQIGSKLAQQVRDISRQLYTDAASYAGERGIIIADTKFEFGLTEDGLLVLMDEALTPDSSRFWPADAYQVGMNPPSFDKQFVRDYLEGLGWNKQPPAPALPAAVVEKTLAKYQEALERLTQ